MATLYSVIFLLAFGVVMVCSQPVKRSIHADNDHLSTYVDINDFPNLTPVPNDVDDYSYDRSHDLIRPKRDKPMSSKKIDSANQRQEENANAAMDAIRRGQEEQEAQRNAERFMAIVSRYRSQGLDREAASRAARNEDPTLARQIDEYNARQRV